jgi:hypothetical protein
VAITAKAAKVLPAPPVTILNALHITLFKEFELTLALALRSCAKASAKPKDEDKTGKIVTAEIATKDKIDRFFEKFFIVILNKFLVILNIFLYILPNLEYSFLLLNKFNLKY